MRKKSSLFILLSIAVLFTGNFSLAIADNQCELLTSRNFGDSFRACESNYFEFTHNYDCSNANTAVSSLDQEIQTRLLGMGLSQDSKVCSFIPKVQVLDNWGWCNGDCQGAGKGCYNDEKKDGDKQCDTSPLRWTSYKDKIIVVPSK